MLIENKVLIEIKSVEKLIPIHQDQLLSYMKLLQVQIGLLINFNSERLVDGIKRLYLPQKQSFEQEETEITETMHKKVLR